MILSYNWQIIDKIPASLEQLKSIVKVPTPEEQQIFEPESPSNTIQPTTLRLPLFGFLFCYYVQQPKSNLPELQIVAELTLLEETIHLRVLQQLRCKNCIFLELLVDNSEIHDVLMTLTVRILYHTGPKPQRIGTIDNLVRLAGNRQLNLYSASTYASIRKELMIQSPVSIEHRHKKEGYLLIKIIRGEDGNNEEVEITGVEVMNWLATGNESLKRQVVVGLLNGSFKLRSKQTYVVAFKMGSSLGGVQMPVALSYRFPPEKRIFKMVRMVRGQTSE